MLLREGYRDLVNLTALGMINLENIMKAIAILNKSTDPLYQ